MSHFLNYGFNLISRILWLCGTLHDDVTKWKHFPRYWPFVRGIHRSPVYSTHKGQWRGALMFFFNLRSNTNKRLSKHSWGWWFETPSRSLWRNCNGLYFTRSVRKEAGKHDLIKKANIHYDDVGAHPFTYSWTTSCQLKSPATRFLFKQLDQANHA